MTEQSAPTQSRGTFYIRTAAILIILCGVGIGGYFWWQGQHIESTDDAFTDGTAISITAQVTGTIVSLDVKDNAFVHKGQALFHIDPRPYIAAQLTAEGALEEARHQLIERKFGAVIARKNFPAAEESAQAQLMEAEATLAQSRADDRRERSLPDAATSRQDRDTAATALKTAAARVASARAALAQVQAVPEKIGQSDAQVNELDGEINQAQGRLDQANLNLEWAVVTAPSDGWVTQRSGDAGSYATPGQQLMTLIAPDVWVTANFREVQLRHMRPGQRVDITVDAYPELKLTGHVDSIQLGSGSRFTAFPTENATGNYVKVVQRVPVKILIDSGLDPKIPLPLGVSVVPTVDITSRTSP